MTDDPRPQKCSYCGQADETVATHSNRLECSGCWNYRKLDRPAALHWAKVAKEFLSNVDFHDLETYLPKALEGGDRTTDWGTMLRSVEAVRLYSERILNDGPPHMWKENASTDAKEPR